MMRRWASVASIHGLSCQRQQRGPAGPTTSSHPHASTARRNINVSSPADLFTSPGGLMALLYGRTGSAPDAAEPRSTRSRGRRGRPRLSSQRGKEPGEDEEDSSGSGGGGSLWRTALQSQALWLAILIFGLSAAWEALKSQQPVLQEKVKNFFFCTLEVRSSREEYAMVMDWMARQPEGQRSHNLAVKPVTLADEEKRRYTDEPQMDDDRASEVGPGYGTHLYTYSGVRLWISRHEDSSKRQGNQAHILDRENDVLSITFFTRDPRVVRRFLDDVRASWLENNKDRVRIMIPDYREWTFATERVRRPLDTLYLSESTKSVVDEIRTFFGLYETYRRLGIPWRRGYLFEGPPGTGKSSLILAIAGELGLPVCILSMQGANLTDEKLLSYVSRLPPRCLLIMEDFENAISAVADGEGKTGGSAAAIGGGKSGNISLSGLLNAMDGVASSEGRVLIMTTNDASRIPIPGALLRPGRIDRRVWFDHLTEEQTAKMRSVFTSVLSTSADPALKNAAAAMDKVHSTTPKAPQSPAEFQQALLDAVYAAHKGATPA